MPPILDNPLFFHSAQGILFLTGAWFLCKAFPTTAFRKPLLLLLNLLFLLSFSAYVPLVVLGLDLCSFLLANAVSRYRNAAFVALGAALLFATSQLLNQPMSGRGIFVTPGGAVGNHLSFSFLAFSLISTFISVHRRELEPPSLLNHALLASFFPTAVSGPILDGKNFLQQLDSPYEAPNPREVVDRFTLGLLKKTVIADRLGLLYHDIFQA